MSLENIKIIGISGKIGSGKTTLQRALMEKYPQFERRSFAENVRRNVSLLTGIDIQNMRTSEQKNTIVQGYNKTLGQLLQDVGEGLREKVHKDVWVESLFSTFDESSFWIIDDLRYENEIQKIKSLGGVCIRLNGDPMEVRKNSTRNLDHSSETALDEYTEFDMVFDTNTRPVNKIVGRMVAEYM